MRVLVRHDILYILSLVLVQINRWFFVWLLTYLLVTFSHQSHLNIIQIVTFTPDFVRHGNVILNMTYPTVTYKVMREFHGVDLCLNDFSD